MLAQISAEILFTIIFFQAYIRKQILQIENDPTLDDIEKARRKQVFMYFRSWCYNHVFFLFRLVNSHLCQKCILLFQMQK